MVKDDQRIFEDKEENHGNRAVVRPQLLERDGVEKGLMGRPLDETVKHHIVPHHREVVGRDQGF